MRIKYKCPKCGVITYCNSDNLMKLKDFKENPVCMNCNKLWCRLFNRKGKKPLYSMDKKGQFLYKINEYRRK